VKGRTILVIDDDPVIQKLLSVNFEMEGYRVVTASDGLEGLAQVGIANPDIILLDVMMPRMDGLEVARKLKSDPLTTAIPIVLLSAKAQSTDIQSGLEAGAEDYITKPFDPLELLDKVGALIGGAG
jgi:CheY-like chemotaxis protein